MRERRDYELAGTTFREAVGTRSARARSSHARRLDRVIARAADDGARRARGLRLRPTDVGDVHEHAH